MIPVIVTVSFLVLFAIVMVAVSVGYRFLETQRKKQVEGMLHVVSGDPSERTESIVLEPVAEDPLESFFRKTGEIEQLRKFIQQAGLTWSPTRLVTSTFIAAIAGALLGWFLRPLGFVALSILAGTLAFGSFPYMYVRVKRRKRLAEIEAQLPEALDFLARSMRAGHAFSISLEMLGQESPDPLGQEFRVLFNEQNLGAPVDVALGNFSDRIPLLDIRMFVSSVLLQRQTGGNLSEILIRLAYVIRERFKLKGQVKAASAHGRMTAMILSILPVFMMLALPIVAPGYLSGMAKDPDGKWMIAGAVVAQLFGYYIMRRIVDIKV
ncbi:MAG: type secretion system protein [Bryobacterales bacterium]|nr:type secretion system protein [Bryobacterales bacterium]